MSKSYRPSLLLAAGLSLLLTTAPCRAALGGLQNDLTQEKETLGASLAVSKPGRYALYAFTNPDGVRIRQYVSATGRVFAVAWDGPVLPDMEVLLGSSYAAYSEGLRQKGGRGVHVRQSALVIESGGMMRSFVGKAYLPDQLPEQMTPQDIQ